MGRLIACSVLWIALATGSARAAQETDWESTWDELERVLEAPEAGDAPITRARLAVLAAKEGQDPRGRLLAVWLERAAGRNPELELREEEVAGLSAHEGWLAARVLAPGRALDRALLVALRGILEGERDALYQAAFEQFVTLSAAYEQDRALTLARAMHESARARWSATNLATALRRAGRFEEAYELLTEQLQATRNGAERGAIHQDRSLVDAGAGWEGRARDDLGAALAHGSIDAAVVLGRMALAEGRFGRARAVFRSVLREEPPQAWALRGWGLSMLPRERERL